MKTNKIIKVVKIQIVILLSTFIFIGCNDSDDSSNTNGSSENSNDKTFSVQAGSDINAKDGSLVKLSGKTSGTSGDVKYEWTQLSGPKAKLTGNKEPTVTVRLPKVDKHSVIVLNLTVTDSQGKKSSDKVIINIDHVNIRDYLPDNLSLSNRASPEIGNGYDTELEHIKPISCLQGTVDDLSSGEEWYIESQTSLDFLDLFKSISMSVSVKGTLKKFFGSVAASYSNEHSYTSMTLNHAFRLQYLGPSKKFRTNGKLTPEAQALYDTDPATFRKIYGDYFFSEVKMGGNLFINAAFKFRNEQIKKQFEYDMSFGVPGTADNPLLAVRSSMDIISEKYADSTEVTISAYMQGGDGTLLSDAFGSFGGVICQCSDGSIENCKNALDRIINWMGESEELLQSFRDNPVPVNFIPYPYSGVIDYMDLTDCYLTPEEREAIHGVFDEYAKTMARKNYVDRYRYKDFTPEERVRYQEYTPHFKAMQATIRNREAVLEPLIDLCYESPLTVLESYNHAITIFNSSSDYEWNDLEWPLILKYEDQFKRADMVYLSPPQFTAIVGIAIHPVAYEKRIEEIFIAYRDINKNGTLGPVKYMMSERTSNHGQAYHPARYYDTKPDVTFLFLDPSNHNYFVTEIIAAASGKRVEKIGLKGREWLPEEKRLGTYKEVAMNKCVKCNYTDISPQTRLTAPVGHFITSFGLSRYKSYMWPDDGIGSLTTATLK